MIYDPTTAPHLKPWLVRTLEPICDAEPGALADYILALLKHNVPEQDMRKELMVQLDEFLEKECPPFIDTLFTVLRTKSYLPYGASPSSPKSIDNGIPIPLDLFTPPPADSNTDRGRKRSIEADDRDGRPPAKGPRLNSESQFSRYGSGGGRSSGHWDGRDENGQGHGYSNGRVDEYTVPMMGGMGGMGHTNGRRQQSYQPPDQKRGICRDYYNNGYCARGAMCKYSHGDDAMIPGQLFPMAPGIPFMPMFPGPMPFGPGASYDPHDARIDMRPRHPQRAPILSRNQQEDGGVVHASGELPVIQDLTPQVPQDSTVSDAPTPDNQGLEQDVTMSGNSHIQPPPQLQQLDTPYEQQGYPTYMQGQQQMDIDTRPGGHRGGYRGRGRGRGTFGGEAHSFRPERRNGKTLVVEKIPEDKLSLENVNDWFKRFGTVTNVAIDKMGGKSLVSFSTHEEAHAAWKSEDAVFNNRFVKVFWHRPMEGQGQVGARMLAASAPVIANMTTKSSGDTAVATPAPSTSTVPPAVRKASATSAGATASALAAKQQVLEQQIAEQKSLMASLETATPEEKKNIMARLRKLGEEMTLSSNSISATSASTSKKSTPVADEHEKKERERLDKELELLSATAPSSSTTNTSTEKQETAEELKAKLEKLKAEAASLGLNTDTAPSDWHAGAPSHRGGYRGRARASRGFYRGAPRGGTSRFNMTLDNRPRKLLLKGVKSDSLQAVKDWYETTGQLDTVDMLDDGDVVVGFKTRAAAEQGLTKGTNIPTVGQVQISWYTVKPSMASGSTSGSKPTDGGSKTKPMDQNETQDGPRAHTPEPEPEEEMVARGWGGDDDGDGMGML